MPTVRLDFELDSEVYPELHAALAALKSPRTRAERVRQLAAAGLVWEKVRLHGPAGAVEAAIEPQAMPAAPPPPAMPPPLSPPAPARRRSRPSRAEVEQVIRELPVLTDVVVDPGEMIDMHDMGDIEDVGDAGEAVGTSPDEGDDDEVVALSASSLHVTALSHKPATRTRLMRMKERGLFKNG